MLASEPKPRRRTAAGEPPEYYTLKEAREILRYSRTTIWRLLRSGALPSRGVGKLRRIPRWAIEMRQQEQ